MPTVPCETIVRACQISRTLRFDNGQLVSTDKLFMSVENLTPFTGIFDVTIDDATHAQCVTEEAFGSKIEFIHEPSLAYTIAKTTMGYTSGNLHIDPPDYIDRWRTIIGECREPMTASRGAMMWDTEGVMKLMRASPSGTVVFEEFIAARGRPLLVRDTNTNDWVGCFMGYVKDGLHHPAATLPEWLR